MISPFAYFSKAKNGAGRDEAGKESLEADERPHLSANR
jgi:hypothetical protein